MFQTWMTFNKVTKNGCKGLRDTLIGFFLLVIYVNVSETQSVKDWWRYSTLDMNNCQLYMKILLKN